MLQTLVLTARYHNWQTIQNNNVPFAQKVNVDSYQQTLSDMAKDEYNKISTFDQQGITLFLNSPAAKYLTDLEKVGIMAGPDEGPHPPLTRTMPIHYTQLLTE